MVGQQVPDGSPRVLERLACEVAGAVEVRDRRLRFVCQRVLGSLQLQHDRGQPLRDGVVDLTREAVALLQHGEILRLLEEEPRVLDRHGELVGERLGGEKVSGVERAGLRAADVEHPDDEAARADRYGELAAGVIAAL